MIRVIFVGLMAVVLIVGGLFVALVFFYQITYNVMLLAPQENTRRLHDTVQAVCDYSRSRIDTEAEEACVVAQERARVTYLCEERSTDADVKCWIKED